MEMYEEEMFLEPFVFSGKENIKVFRAYVALH